MQYLVATDGSEVSDTAVEYAASQAGLCEADLDVAHVLTPETKLIDGNIVFPGEDDALDHAERTLERAAKVATTAAEEHDAVIDVTTEILTGRPAKAIAKYADRTGADAIYVGHRGLSAEQEQVVGSVAKNVVDKASVPVTIIK